MNDHDFVVNVTQDDIQLGSPGEPRCCAVALAVVRTLHADVVTVGDDYIDALYYGEESRRRSFPTPASVYEFIQRYDDGEPVEPFSFVLGGETPCCV